MRKISIKGVLLGGITDVLNTNILAIPLIIYVMAKMDWSHTPKDQLNAAILGGYVAARLAKHDEL